MAREVLLMRDDQNLSVGLQLSLDKVLLDLADVVAVQECVHFVEHD